jgi:hypothetical protein
MVGSVQSNVASAVLFAAVASIIPFRTMALSLDQCPDASDIMMPHEVEGDYEDFGGSLIAYQRGGSSEGVSWNYIYLVSCRSGETLSLYVNPKDSTSDDVPRSEVAMGMIRGMVASPISYKFADGKAVLAVAEFDVELTTADAEICACKALYPNDRRGKTPYVFKSFWVDEPAVNGDNK